MGKRETLIDAILENMLEMAVTRSTSSPDPWLHVELSMAELKAIFLLCGRGPLRIGAIGEALGLSPNATTAVVDRLQQRGLVLRAPDPHDRRVVLVDLLPEGAAMVEELQAAGIEAMRRRLDAMAVTDLEALQRGMAALLAQMREAELDLT